MVDGNGACYSTMHDTGTPGRNVDEIIDGTNKNVDEINVIVMSEAGKPIYSRFGTEEDTSKICAFVSAIRTSLEDNDRFSLGDIESLCSDAMTAVFMAVGSMVLMAIASSTTTTDENTTETEAYLRLQLEYVYSQIIFVLTEQVQNAFQQDPSFDLRNMLGAQDTAMIGYILDQAGPQGNTASFFSGGVDSVFPIDSSVREETCRKMVDVGKSVENTVFALLIADGKLLSLVQPNYRPHQMRTSDLQLILNFIKHQPELLTSELWFPVCLPRFNSTGFLYAYTNCFDSATKLCLVLVSQHNTTEQFELFRVAATALRQSLGLPAVVGSVLRILESGKPCDFARSERSSERDCQFDDVAWKRSKEEALDENDEEGEYTMIYGTDDIISLSQQSKQCLDTDVEFRCPLLKELHSATDKNVQESLLEEYCRVASAIHFVFRIDVAVLSNVYKSDDIHSLIQCISPHVGFPFCDIASKRRMWSMYQKLNLRLRLGSASVEATMNAFDKITYYESQRNEKDTALNGIGKHCPAIGLAESPPTVHGITYIIDNTEIFLGLNGIGFELYVTLPGCTQPQQAAELGKLLVENLMSDHDKLFLTTPLTWPN